MTFGTTFLKSCAVVLLFASTAQCQLWVSSDFGNAVLQYDANTGAVLANQPLIAAGSGSLNQPHGIIDRRSGVLVASFGTHEVKRYDRMSGAFIDNFIPTSAGLNSPVYLAIGPNDGLLYVSSQGNDRIMRFNLETGAAIDSSPFIDGGSLDGPSGFDWSPDGTILYVAGRYSANVLAYDATTGAPLEFGHEFASGLGSGNTFGLIVDRDTGDVFVASNGNVLRYAADGHLITTINTSGTIGLENGPDGTSIYAAANNNLYRIAKSANSVTGPLLAGGSINILNFFHFSQVGDPVLSEISSQLDQEVPGEDYLTLSWLVAGLTSGSIVSLQWSPDLTVWDDAATYTLVGRKLERDAGAGTTMVSAPGTDSPFTIVERTADSIQSVGQRFFRVVATGK